MALSDLVAVTILAATASPTREGFGTPLVMASKVPASMAAVRTKEYASPKEMTDDGWLVNDPGYRCASACFANNPRPAKVKIGKRLLVTAQVVQFTVTDATEGAVYTLDIVSQLGVVTSYSYTVLASATTTTVATALAAQWDAHADTVGTSSTATVTLTTVANKLLRFKEWTPNLKFKDTSADPGIATDLAAVYAADTNWYGLLLDSNSEAEVDSAATWVEANKKFFQFTSADWGCQDAGTTTDVASDITAGAYARTSGIFSLKDSRDYPAAAWMGNRFPFDPGSEHWEYKTLPGITYDNLTGAQVTALLAKNMSVYIRLAGVNITRGGKSGSGEWLDVTRFVDWQKSDIEVSVYAVLLNNSKVPFTDTGGDMIRSQLLASLARGVRQGGLVPGSVVVNIPKVADISSLDKAARLFTGITFSATLAGAISKLTMSGTLSV